ncbi:hypothetical protein HPP92_023349 [Vanilla planifolia]|uniref:Acidic leucine-rich nuclear phosphoprotein 32-related protein n=1 Tax=Vanilla planifolia TaxID=51239 RepID=A0A835PTT0_VANPL|nr:hypothetical protein HPP92_023349 [Vanilla planifolia]
MDEAWERSVETALEAQKTPSSELRALNLDGAVKSLHGCLPPAELLERFPSLEHLSIANVGAHSLERFPRLSKLQNLSLSDNRIAGGLERLVEAGLYSLRDLDLSNNRIQFIEDLAPLSQLQLVSLDLYECPVTRVDGYRSKVFSMIRTLKYLDKLDVNGNERLETDDEEEEEEEEDEYDEEEEDPGSGEVDGDDQGLKIVNGAVSSTDRDAVILDADEDDGSDADEEQIEIIRNGTHSESTRGYNHRLSNGFQVAAAAAAAASTSVDGDDNDDEEDVDDEDDNDGLGEEIDEEEVEEDDIVEVHDVLDSDDDDEDAVDDVGENEEEIDEDDVDDDAGDEDVDDDNDYDDDDDDDDDEEEDEEDDVDEEEDDVGVEDEEDGEPGSTGRLASVEEEIDGHDLGEEDENGEIGEEDENGEIGEEDELDLDDRNHEEDYSDGEEEDDLDGEYLVQPIVRQNGSEGNVGNVEDEDVGRDEQLRNGTLQQATSSDASKRRRDEEGDVDDENFKDLKVSKRR